MDSSEGTAHQFSGWALPLVMRGEMLSRIVAEHDGIDDKAKQAFARWSEEARQHYTQIEEQIRNDYGMPELYMLRVEACLCIIQGQWQGAVCMTNVLLEAFLKLALVYSNMSQPEEHAQPLSRLMNSVSAPAAKYMQLKLNDTINIACTQGLITKEAKKALHGYRERFRNAFFHADMQAMFGDQTTPMTGADFGTFEVEHDSVTIHSLPLLLGEAMWQNARANGIPYFKEVDALIRRTLPKVFPNLSQEQAEGTSEEDQ